LFVEEKVQQQGVENRLGGRTRRLTKSAEMAEILDPRRQHDPKHRRTERSTTREKCFEHFHANCRQNIL
jgi:hypothetical protein